MNMMIKRGGMNRALGILLGATGLMAVMAGCAGGDDESAEAPRPLPASEYQADSEKALDADAGVSLGAHKTDLDPKLKIIAQSKNYGSRTDPFALLAAEVKYEQSQSAERFIQSAGGFSNEWTPPEDKAPDVIEQQPYRRLAGVMVGTSVLAMIDMGDGKIEIIRPGQKVGEWTVVSIDLEKAVLTRKGSKKPHMIEVPLQKPLGGVLNPSGSGLTGGSAGSRSGYPGGYPPGLSGYPGGPMGPGGMYPGQD